MSVRLGLMLLALGCAEKTAPEVAEQPIDGVDIEWGSWELTTTFVGQDDICESLTADGSGITELYGEMDVQEPNEISLSLGDQELQGTRDESGFDMEGFREIPVTNNDGTFGIGATLSAEVSSPTAFTGEFAYVLDFPNGLCTINLEVDAYWMYYEPPPSCGG